MCLTGELEDEGEAVPGDVQDTVQFDEARVLQPQTKPRFLHDLGVQNLRSAERKW